MKILLISANKEMLPDPVAPLGLAYLAAALTDKQHEIAIADLCFVQGDKKTLGNTILSFKPDIIGISVRNIDNVSFPNSISYLPFYKEVVSWCREYSRAPIIAGGAGFTLMPDDILTYIDADYGIVGEGEESLPKLITAIADGGQRIDVSGVITRRSSFKRQKGPSAFLDFDRIPFPRRDLLDTNTYMRYGGMGNIQTRRGCIGRCIYCTYPLIEGKAVRLRNPQKVADEIEYMKKELNIDTFFIVDAVFNYPPENAQDMCKELIKRNLMVKWSCYCSPAFASEDLLSLMKESGCTGVEFGTDSCANTVLQNLRKDFTLQDIIEASQACRKADMSYCHSLLFGAPGETKQTVIETLRIMDDINPTAVIIMTGIRIYPGTELARIAKMEGIIAEREISLNPVFYMSSAVESSILEVVGEYAQKHSNCIVPGQNIMSDYAMQKKLRHYGIKGPLWEHMKFRRQKRKASQQ